VVTSFSTVHAARVMLHNRLRNPDDYFYCESPALRLIAESWRPKNNDYISGIPHFSHKGQTRIIWKTGSEVGAGRALKK